MHPSYTLMGILNVTPDSFSDGGLYHTPVKAYDKAARMIEAGADVIDIGGESTRPGATGVSAQEEQDRVLPVIERIQASFNVRLSIDTSSPALMKESIKRAVWMINDIRAFQRPGAVEAVAGASCQLCVMHMQGEPQTMQASPDYPKGVVHEVHQFFKKRLSALAEAGVSVDSVWLDPGVGFGKTTAHNLMLLKHISVFKALECPMLVGLSRKRIFGDLLQLPVEKRMAGGLAGAVYLWLQGVNMIRTHDVKETKEAMLFLEALNRI